MKFILLFIFMPLFFSSAFAETEEIVPVTTNMDYTELLGLNKINQPTKVFNGWAKGSDSSPDGSSCLNVVFIKNPNGTISYYSKEWRRGDKDCDYEATQGHAKVTPAFCVQDDKQHEAKITVKDIPALNPGSPDFNAGTRTIDFTDSVIQGSGCTLLNGAKAPPLTWKIHEASLQESTFQPGRQELRLVVGSSKIHRVTFTVYVD